MRGISHLSKQLSLANFPPIYNKISRECTKREADEYLEIHPIDYQAAFTTTNRAYPSLPHPSKRTMFRRWGEKKIAAETLDPFYVSFIRRSQARLKCRERFTVKQVLGLIAAMILLLCINSVIVVTKSICHDTWGVVKLFNVYYKNNVLTSSPTLTFLSRPCAPRFSLCDCDDDVDS